LSKLDTDMDVIIHYYIGSKLAQLRIHSLATAPVGAGSYGNTLTYSVPKVVKECYL